MTYFGLVMLVFTKMFVCLRTCGESSDGINRWSKMCCTKLLAVIAIKFHFRELRAFLSILSNCRLCTNSGVQVSIFHMERGFEVWSLKPQTNERDQVLQMVVLSAYDEHATVQIIHCQNIKVTLVALHLTHLHQSVDELATDDWLHVLRARQSPQGTAGSGAHNQGLQQHSRVLQEEGVLRCRDWWSIILGWSEHRIAMDHILILLCHRVFVKVPPRIRQGRFQRMVLLFVAVSSLQSGGSDVDSWRQMVISYSLSSAPHPSLHNKHNNIFH